MLCDADKESLFSVQSFSHQAFGYRLTTPEDYIEACEACEKWATFEDRAQVQTVAAALFWDKRKQGSKGRALSRNIPEFGLERGDRLEPCDTLPDVAELENAALPIRVVFWRPSCETK
eukprot:12820137-Alexandrium_andersonii.AAC.1